jgi:biotin carboxylase
VAAAQQLGIDLVMATDVPSAAQRFGCEVVTVDFATHRLVGPLPSVDGIVAVDERSAVTAARLVREGIVSAAFHSVVGVTNALDKGLMRRCLSAAGVRCPVVLARVPRGAPVPRVRFPCVVKPPQLSGSLGVIRADDEHTLGRAVHRARTILHRHRRAANADPSFFELLVESYEEGLEVAVEGLMSNGSLMVMAIFDKPDPLTGPFFEETLYVTPSLHSVAVQAALMRATEAAAVAMGLTHGPVHAELRIDDAGVSLIEIAARSIGGLCSRTFRYVIGSLERALLEHAVGAPVRLVADESAASGVMMIPVPKTGVVRHIGGIEVARAVPGIDGIEFTASVGDIVRAAPDGESYLGFMFAHGGDAGWVQSALREAHRHLTIDVVPLLPVVSLGETPARTTFY